MPADASLIRTEWAEERYGFAETDRPCIFAREDRLYLTAGEDVADITPEEINISYYGSFMDFNEILSYKKNCVVSEDGRYIVYRLEFNDIPYLYYYDIEARKAYFISDRVDSFDLVENDGTEALTLIYATATPKTINCFCIALTRQGKPQEALCCFRKTTRYPAYSRPTAASFRCLWRERFLDMIPPPAPHRSCQKEWRLFIFPVTAHTIMMTTIKILPYAAERAGRITS